MGNFKTNCSNFKEVVYLDSSDLSRFADIEREVNSSKNDIELYNFCKLAVEQGSVVFPLSMVHLGEALRHPPEKRHQAQARATVMETLSAGWSYPTIEDLFFHDLIVASSPEKAHSERVRRLTDIQNRWSWVPNFETVFQKQISSTSEMIKTMLAERNLRANRATRRHLESRMHEFIGPESQEAIARNFDDAAGRKLSFCRRPEFARALVGKGSFRKIQSEMEVELGAPTTVVSLEADKRRMADIVYGPIDKFQSKLSETMTELIDQIGMTGYEGSKPQADLLKRIFANMELRIPDKIYHNMLPRLNRFGIKSISKIDDLKYKEKSFDALLSNIAAYYVLDMVLKPEMARKPKPSDGGDILHLLYLPLSTIWLGDGYSASLALRAFKGNSSCTISADRSLLKNRLESALAP